MQTDTVTTSSRTEATALLVSGLVRDFGRGKVIGPVSLEIAAPSRVALTGPNGSGKSTILRCIAGTLAPTRGHISIRGHAADSLRARSLLGVSLSQERSFDLRLSGRANLVFFARLRGHDPRAAAAAVSDLESELELEEIASERVSNCSTGMTQQLSFARALLGEPILVLLDEPTRSLDEAARDRLWGALDRRPHVSVLIATHRDDDVANCHHQVELVG